VRWEVFVVGEFLPGWSLAVPGRGALLRVAGAAVSFVEVFLVAQRCDLEPLTPLPAIGEIAFDFDPTCCRGGWSAIGSREGFGEDASIERLFGFDAEQVENRRGNIHIAARKFVAKAGANVGPGGEERVVNAKAARGSV
jgi:hypothetical protein